MSNVISFNKAAYLKRRKECTNVVDLGGTKFGHYLANVKSEIMMFVFSKVRDLSVEEAIEKMEITEVTYTIIKNLRVSQISIDNLFEISFNIGYTFDMYPYDYTQDKENTE